MRRTITAKILPIAIILPLFYSLPVEAQKRGRTDGPPGSHIGAGGYSPAGFREYSLELQFGAAITEQNSSSTDGVPLSFGLAMAFWADEWIRMDIAAHYLADTERFQLFAGPRFQTGYWPVSASAGIKAGMIMIPEAGLRFGISPQIGAEILLGDNLLMGIGWAIDIPMGERGNHNFANRPYMNIGYRF